MKIKVKGLVFVGFAAAILSANAMADPSGTTITSLAYTEDTYQKLSNIQTSFTDQNEESDTLYPSMGAVSAKITSAVGSVPTYNTFTGATAQNNGAAGLVPAPTTADVNKVLGGNGNWIGAFGGTNGTTAGTTGLVPAPTTADKDKVLTGGGTWIGSFGGTNGTTAGTTGLVPAPTTADKDKVLGGSGSWVGVNNTGSVASNATNTAKDLITEYTLSNTIKNLPSASIPGQSSLCTAALPCALVAEGTNYHWRVMAVSASQATTAGTLADFCDANTSCTLGTCNTTNNANVCVEQ